MKIKLQNKMPTKSNLNNLNNLSRSNNLKIVCFSFSCFLTVVIEKKLNRILKILLKIFS